MFLKKVCIVEKNKSYLELIPIRSETLKWSQDENGLVIFEIENKGALNKFLQKCFKRPKYSYIHLDDFGSYIWKEMDGIRTVLALGVSAEIKFGDKVLPLYQRLSNFFSILESYGFITIKNYKKKDKGEQEQ